MNTNNRMNAPCAIHFQNVSALPSASRLPAAIVESGIMIPADLRRFVSTNFKSFAGLAANLNAAGYACRVIDSQGRTVNV